jgi:hypothetical protein
LTLVPITHTTRYLAVCRFRRARAIRDMTSGPAFVSASGVL